jgi:hypothetical protein
MSEAPFPPNSRYHGAEITEHVLPDGRRVRHLRRRFVPEPQSHSPLALHRVATGDRLDLLAERYYGDPLQFWRLCDANPVLRPAELLERVGAELTVPYPLEIPGDGNP